MLPRTLRTQSISGLCHRPLSIINFLLWRATFLSIKNRLPAEITYPGMPHDFLLLPCGLLWLQQSSSSHIVSNHLHPGDTGDWNWITRQELQPPSLLPSLASAHTYTLGRVIALKSPWTIPNESSISFCVTLDQEQTFCSAPHELSNRGSRALKSHHSFSLASIPTTRLELAPSKPKPLLWGWCPKIVTIRLHVYLKD